MSNKEEQGFHEERLGIPGFLLEKPSRQEVPTVNKSNSLEKEGSVISPVVVASPVDAPRVEDANVEDANKNANGLVKMGPVINSACLDYRNRSSGILLPVDEFVQEETREGILISDLTVLTKFLAMESWVFSSKHHVPRFDLGSGAGRSVGGDGGGRGRTANVTCSGFLI